MAIHYEYRKLRGRIVEKYRTIAAFAKVVGISEVAVYNKLNCKTGFSQKDIEKWTALLDIDNSEISEYFFA